MAAHRFFDKGLTMSRLSVAMTTYNGEKFVAEQLRSIAAQTRLPDELVVCDDRSQDGTVAILKAFAETAPFPVKVVENPENLGYVRNFCKAVSMCSGDLVFLSDQDDIWKPGKAALFEQVAEANDDRPVLIFSDADIVDDQSRKIDESLWRLLKMPPPGHNFEELKQRNLVTGATCAMNRKLIDVIDMQYIPNHVPHDQSFTLLAWATGKIVPIDQKLISYRLHQNNQIGVQRTRLEHFRHNLQRLTGNKTEDMEIHFLEIAKLLQNLDRAKAKLFWRKAAFFRLMNNGSRVRFFFIGRKYFAELFDRRQPLAKILIFAVARRIVKLLKIQYRFLSGLSRSEYSTKR